MNKICITTDCACDLPTELLRSNNIDIIYFYIITEHGRFRDLDEVTAQNLFDHWLNGGKQAETTAPSVDEFKEFFLAKLKDYDEIIHIGISSRISRSVENSTEALNQMGEDRKRVHIFDSLHLSTGIGHLVLIASDLLKRGHDVSEILSTLEQMRTKVSTTFMVQNAEYLYRNGRISKNVKNLCDFFHIRPVLRLVDGYIKLDSVLIGGYEESALRYVRRELRKHKHIKKDRLFITHAGCTVNDIKIVRKEVEKLIDIDNIIISDASATISGNSGPRTFGVLFVKE